MDTSPKDQRALLYGAQPPSENTERRPGEPLFAFVSDGHRYVCELRTSGYGVEARFFRDGELLTARTLATRAIAIWWAQDTRTILEQS